MRLPLSSRAQRGICTIALVLIAHPLRAQCPDGSPPPCASARVARPVDPNRIAVLPFRVTTRDTLLGEGFAELLASEFAGDEGPRAIDMATVISAWRRAGGGLRTPLPRERALSLARELGAGLVFDGSIVGLGERITITTTIVDATKGVTRGRPTRVIASPDSVDHALRQTASGLVAALGGQQRTLEGARYTESPEAMRYYLQALTLWRRGRLQDAQRLLERALTTDSTFAQAAFRLHFTGFWGLRPGTLPAGLATRRAFQLRTRLSTPERILIESVLGTNWPAPRLIAERLAEQTRAAELLPDSPEAQFLAGDVWYHYGAPVDHVNQLTIARRHFERAVTIDSQATTIRHLTEVAILQRDTALLRSILPAYARTEDIGLWGGLFLGWSILGDERELGRLRRQVIPPGSDLGHYWAVAMGQHADVSAARFAELWSLWAPATHGTPQESQLRYTYGFAQAARGRPAVAEAAWTNLNETEAINADRFRLMIAMSGDATGLDVEGAHRRLMHPVLQERSLIACETALWRVLRGGGTYTDSTRHFTGGCGRALVIARMSQDSLARSIPFLQAADSAIANHLNLAPRAYEQHVLARAWERLGQPQRALRAIRYRTNGTFLSDASWLTPEDIRLALVAGDTTGAERALEYYLPVIRDAEPPHAAKRDSLAALLARLRRR